MTEPWLSAEEIAAHLGSGATARESGAGDKVGDA